LVTRASHENPALGLVAAVGSRLARLLSTNHQARGAPAPAVIWLLLLAGERPKEEPLGRGRWGDKGGVSSAGRPRWTIELDRWQLAPEWPREREVAVSL
jgi:hypothetical protein